MAVPLLQGCTDPTHNPLAAASGAAKLSGTGEEDGLAAMADLIANELTAEELASLVNLGLGKDWSLDDANALKDLLGQIDEEKGQALEDAGIDEANTTDEQVKQAFADAGLDATDEQIDLLRDLFDAVEGVDGGSP
ncbi:unnamed protein product [marine sediment metagenome]|uniref:Uncharacterized protein n=1 Tax=marine sediment metagenome TaxID=412755 RepID=X0V6K7_9ZZZZ